MQVAAFFKLAGVNDFARIMYGDADLNEGFIVLNPKVIKLCNDFPADFTNQFKVFYQSSRCTQSCEQVESVFWRFQHDEIQMK